MTQPLVCISVRQPWAYAIVYLGKDVENRRQGTTHRGLTLIHASAVVDEDYDKAVRFIDDVRARLGVGHRLPPRRGLDLGGIIGAVDVTGVVEESRSPWFVGPKGVTMRNARPLPFTPCKGTIFPTFWAAPEAVRGALGRALARGPA